MALTATPLTELDAVNEILGTGSESPVSTLEDNEVIDAALALKILRVTSAEVQKVGWWFNEEDNYPLNPDQTGTIRVPGNTLKVVSPGDDIILRGLRLYSKASRSYTFESPIEVSIVFGLPFEELPASARDYITIRAARKYQDRYIGDDAVHTYTKQDEQMAMKMLDDEELESRPANMLSDSLFMQTLLRRT